MVFIAAASCLSQVICTRSLALSLSLSWVAAPFTCQDTARCYRCFTGQARLPPPPNPDSAQSALSATQGHMATHTKSCYTHTHTHTQVRLQPNRWVILQGPQKDRRAFQKNCSSSSEVTAAWGKHTNRPLVSTNLVLPPDISGIS